MVVVVTMTKSQVVSALYIVQYTFHAPPTFCPGFLKLPGPLNTFFLHSRGMIGPEMKELCFSFFFLFHFQKNPLSYSVFVPEFHLAGNVMPKPGKRAPPPPLLPPTYLSPLI